MKPATLIATTLYAFCMLGVSAARQQDANQPMTAPPMSTLGHETAARVRLSYEDLTKTAAMLETARNATAKYRDVRVAEAEGFRAIGPDVPGMGIHFVGPHRSSFLNHRRKRARPRSQLWLPCSARIFLPGDSSKS